MEKGSAKKAKKMSDLPVKADEARSVKGGRVKVEMYYESHKAKYATDWGITPPPVPN